MSDSRGAGWYPFPYCRTDHLKFAFFACTGLFHRVLELYEQEVDLGSRRHSQYSLPPSLINHMVSVELEVGKASNRCSRWLGLGSILSSFSIMKIPNQWLAKYLNMSTELDLELLWWNGCCLLLMLPVMCCRGAGLLQKDQGGKAGHLLFPGCCASPGPLFGKQQKYSSFFAFSSSSFS